MNRIQVCLATYLRAVLTIAIEPCGMPDKIPFDYSLKHLLLVAGVSGCGKSTLINELSRGGAAPKSSPRSLEISQPGAEHRVQRAAGSVTYQPNLPENLAASFCIMKSPKHSKAAGQMPHRSPRCRFIRSRRT